MVSLWLSSASSRELVYNGGDDLPLKRTISNNNLSITFHNFIFNHSTLLLILQLPEELGTI